MPVRNAEGETRQFITSQDSDVATTVGGANGMEEIFDLEPPAGVYYRLYSEDHHRIAGDAKGAIRLRLTLTQDAATTEIGEDATVIVVAQDPTEEGETQIGPTFRYSQFKNANQYDNEDVVRLSQMPDGQPFVEITEGAHLKLKVDNSSNGNDVDLSESDAKLEFEMFRGKE